MIEIRSVMMGKRFVTLQYRYLTPSVDASGCFCPPGEWSTWRDIETVDVNDVAYEDLAASGGLFPPQEGE